MHEAGPKLIADGTDSRHKTLDTPTQVRLNDVPTKMRRLVGFIFPIHGTHDSRVVNVPWHKNPF